MPDIADRPYDDAPVSTSKDQDAAVRIATAEAVEDRGDSFAGWAVTINRHPPNSMLGGVTFPISPA